MNLRGLAEVRHSPMAQAAVATKLRQFNVRGLDAFPQPFVTQ
jgi:hypothetical protein